MARELLSASPDRTRGPDYTRLPCDRFDVVTPEQEHPSDSVELALFALDEQTYAIRLAAILEVVQSVEISDLPTAPPVVAGVIDLRGEIVPVFDVRSCFDHRRRALRLSDHFVIVQAAERTAVLWVDQMLEVRTVALEQIDTGESFSLGARAVAGVAALPSGLCVIAELDEFLTEAEGLALDAALSGEQE